MQHHAATATAVDTHSDDAGMRAYLDLLASGAPLTPAGSTAFSSTSGAAAYLALLASDAPLAPAAPARADRPAPAVTSADPAVRAYLDLLASDAPLTPADLLPATAAGPRPAPSLPATSSHGLPASSRGLSITPRGLTASSHGLSTSSRGLATSSRHLSTSSRGLSFAAPALFSERGRHAVVAAALAVGVGVAGLGVGVAAVASPSRADSIPVAAPVLRKSAAEQTPTDPTSGLSGTAAHHVVEDDLAVRDAVTPTEEMLSDAPQRSSAPALRKPKPLPKPKPVAVTTVAWVNPLPEASTTSCFGQRWGRLHAGVDLAAPHGTRIRAAGAGVVVAAGEEGGYGNAVLIDHGNGFLTHYGHMSAITVTAGQKVKAGDQIGNEGSTGHSTGPHLHFEVHKGHYKNPIEPTAWMRAHNVEIPGCTPETPHTH